jgi:hypothetical protein
MMTQPNKGTRPCARSTALPAPMGRRYEPSCVLPAPAKIREDGAMITLPPPITALLAEMAADSELVHSVGEFRAAFENLEHECFSNHHASQFMTALAMVSEQRRPLRDRMIDICDLAQARGRVTVVIKRDATND